MKALAIFEVMMTVLFWGFGFTATIWSLQTWSPVQTLVLRFTIVGLIGLAIAAFKNPGELKRLLKLTFVPSFFLMLELIFQVFGMEKTNAIKGGFLTVMFIVFVPVLEGMFLKSRVTLAHCLWVAVGIAGAFLMMRIETLEVNIGDVLILLSAVAASFHILYIDKIGKNEPQLFTANALQSFWGALFVLPLLFVSHDPWPATASMKSIFGLTSLIFGTTLLAFYFQMRSQKTLSPSVSSLLFLLESPLAALFAIYLLGEKLDWIQWCGCGLILLAAAGATFHFFTTTNPAEQNTNPEVSADT